MNSMNSMNSISMNSISNSDSNSPIEQVLDSKRKEEGKNKDVDSPLKQYVNCTLEQDVDSPLKQYVNRPLKQDVDPPLN
jgi:hypothetical protein